jgi:hypothetical protein
MALLGGYVAQLDGAVANRYLLDLQGRYRFDTV